MRRSAFLFSAVLFSTIVTMAQHSDIQKLIESVQQQYTPDKRVEIFNIKPIKRKDTLILKGETSSLAAYRVLLTEAEKLHLNVKDSIRLLPDKKTGEETWGIIYNSVGTLRADKRYSSELVSQALLGMPVRILDKDGGWRRIQTPDAYIGWMNGSVKPMTKKTLQRYLKSPKVIITSIHAMTYEQPDIKAQPVSDLVAGNMLEIIGEKDDFYAVRYPDERKGYILKTDASKVDEWQKNIELTSEGIVKTAHRFMGIPYLWGGTSAKGVDCSGFTKSVYFLHGILLARDASQQVRYGKLVDSTGDFSNALPGDLVFFGEKTSTENPKERVVHVGIYIGNKRFIHASDYIRINSFDPNDALYDAYNTGRYLRTRRVIGEVNTPGIEEFFKNEFYK